VIVEIKSLNSKQLDLNVKLPFLYKEKELEVRNLVGDIAQRGKVDVSIFFEFKGDCATREINKTVIRAYFNQFQALTKEFGLPDDNLFGTIMKMPDVFSTEVQEFDNTEWSSVLVALREACVNLAQYRATEGDALGIDILGRVSIIRRLMSELEPFEVTRVAKIREKMKANLEELVTIEKIDHNRFEQELIYYFEKLDISEEKVRLIQHCDYFEETAQEQDNAGRKLGFIVQEMGREINTIGSKSNDAAMQKIVVQMKDELEKIKEQVLNVL
jgi:uncharacterized protein (TIGR00255 family)